MLGAYSKQPPNVLFIAIDDQNDWLGCMDGHPLVKTPNIDKLAAGGTLFLNAHVQAPICNPSRTSIMLGLRPSTTGIHGLGPWFRTVPALADAVSLPQHFANHGYRTSSVGKIKNPEFQHWGEKGGYSVPKNPTKLVRPGLRHGLLDWGVWPDDNDDTRKGDYKVASSAISMLESSPQDQPFFLAVGFYLPHVPIYVTQKWYDLYPNDDSVLPPILPNDRADTPRSSWWGHWDVPEPRLKWLETHKQNVHLARSYLAATSFVDEQVGRVLRALDASGHGDNTIVVLWSDHGWHLGEKGITGKCSLWGRSTRVPLIFAGPGITTKQRCRRPAELLDVYPTLIDLCGLPARPDLEGRSLKPQLVDAKAPRTRPAVTSHNQGNFSVVNEQWRYVRYVDGAEELYDLTADFNEHHNLAAKPEYAPSLRQMRKHVPKIDNPPVPGTTVRVLTYDNDIPTWQGKPIGPSDPIPGL
jgi:arylsulfatase A-like enzyme